MKKIGIDILEDLVRGQFSIEDALHTMHEENKVCNYNHAVVNEFLLRVKNAYKGES